MEAFKLRAYSRRRQKKVHCSSPLPGVAASIPRGSSKAGPFQPCRRLFAPPLRESNAQSVKGNPNVKALSKINENFEVTKVNNSADQSVQLNDEKITNTDIRGKSTTQLKESLQSNCESNESWRNSETTSGMTLPTGVSTFLLDCLDMDSSTESIDSMNSCPSPEIFRNEDSLDRNNSNPEECLKYKNSTLLDTSKAVTIDKMPQLSNLSEILEPIYEGHQDQYVGRESPTKCNKDSSKLMNVSTIVAGKQVGKIMSSTEKTPDAKISLFSSVSGRRKRQDMNSKVLITEKHRQLLTSTAYFQPEELESVHHEERQNKKLNRKNKEICSIVKTSPGLVISMGHRIPVNRNMLNPSEGITEGRNVKSKYLEDYIKFGFTCQEKGVDLPQCVTSAFYNKTNNAVHAPYIVAYKITQAKKPHTIVEQLVLPRAKEMLRLVHGEEAARKLNDISVSNDTLSRRIN
ncbi:meiosis-specific kinetochore protein isoform X6 [Pelodiscus sinensis]|uniref:meiosis-specific kinetochore protein isoform X6 n=1 Tax=Pelodiscus sinensis TaxID=13735 RepID=UPI000D7206EC|nr:meiosis-specific kinetochore protein isoform X8 [Pelodiscus sinensis]|eukprot:XP_025037020.1 meiosis-specific kinetochore protein isoform X8 [Pelodiscus sinensis]